jgi:type I restriction enzyme S subunit
MKMLQVRDNNYNLRFVFEMMQTISFYAPEHKRYWISRYSKIRISVPDIEEQNAIAKVLTEMDSEINALQARLDKYKQLKLGMMQQLLTGRIRLK